MVAEACKEVLPKGVVNVLTGTGNECGAAIVSHPGVNMLSFTGSTRVGREIMRKAADRIVPVALELGGKSPSIVFPDADIDRTARDVITAMRFTRQSQSCTAGSRLFLHSDIFDEFLSKLTQMLSQLVIGDPLDERSDVGSIINKRQFDSVCSFIQEGLSDPSMRLVYGGIPPQSGPLSEGYYALPTVFVATSNETRLLREEIFGPVLTVVRWTDEETVIRLANDSQFGLAAFIWTRDIARALSTANAIEAGWVQVNQGAGQVLGQSYGGYKQSGIGRECSLEGMLESFTQRKNITVNLHA
jgi:betaine-aldehyde dehydrogenase